MESLGHALPNLPSDLTNALQIEFATLESRYSRSDWGPAELSGGRFAEAVLRYLEWLDSGGDYTPIGQHLNRQRILNRITNNTSLPDGIRFHVSKCTEILMDIRNRRDVAHLGRTADVNRMDASLVMRLASWILAEIIREEGALATDKTQVIIDKLSAKRIPLVEEVNGNLIVLATNLNAKDRALVALYQKYPDAIELEILRRAVSYVNSSRFRQIILGLEKEAYTFVNHDTVHLTNKGLAWVEKNVEMELDF